MDTKDKIEIMQAREAGKTIEMCQYGYDSWSEIANPDWNWIDYNYRIKPEPRSIWVNYYHNGRIGYAYETKQKAINTAGGVDKVKTIEFIEVIK